MTPLFARHQLALSTHGFQGWDPLELIRRVASDYRLGTLDYWPAARGQFTPEAYRTHLAQAGMTVLTVNAQSSHGRIGVLHERVPATEEIDRAIAEATALGATYVQFYTGVPANTPYIKVADVIAGELKVALDHAERAGITLLLENNLDQRGERPVHCNPSREVHVIEALLALVDSEHLALTFDPGNFLTVGEEAYPLAYEVLYRWIRNVHLKDPRRYRPHLHAGSRWSEKLLVDSQEGAFLSVPVGQGAVAWDALTRRFATDGYAGAWTVDPFCAEGVIDPWCSESLSFLSRYFGDGSEQEPGDV